MYQIFHRTYLAGGMPQESVGNVGCIHAAAIIRDPDHRDAAFFNLCDDGRGSCIDGIFHQFLYDRCGAFDYFSGGDLINRNRV